MVRAPVLSRGALVAVILLAAPAPARAWSYDAHKVICAIAQEELGDELSVEVLRLARSHRTPDGWSYRWFTTGCTYADLARDRARDGRDGWTRFHRFSPWHFMNLPRDERRLERDEAHDHCGGDCVLHGVRYHAARLSDRNLSDQDRAEALLFLAHWVGDLHQPLHVGYRDDRGGYRIDDLEGGGYRQRNLHAVWDTGIPERARAGRDWWTWAGDLAREITPRQRTDWQGGDAVDWAAESYALAIDVHLGYCTWRDGACRSAGDRRVVDEGYQERFEPVMRRRLQQAGVRLAVMIREALAPSGHRGDPSGP